MGVAKENYCRTRTVKKCLSPVFNETFAFQVKQKKMFDIINWWLLHRFNGNNRSHFAKDCLLTLVKSRLALGSPGCLFVCDHAENGPIQRKMVVDCPLVITTKVKLFFRPDKTRKKELMVQPVFCIVDAGSCLLGGHILNASDWRSQQNPWHE